MKRFSTLLNRTKSSNNIDLANAPLDSPQANISKAIGQFCESSSDPNGNDEAHVLHLPVIVEAAESSPVASAAAAQRIRRFLTREWATKPHVQYHAVMLIRILSDNPGPTFTRNFDKSFVSTVKEVLRNSRDASTQQILRETLDSLEANKPDDQGLQGLIQMWRKEKGYSASLNQPRGTVSSNTMVFQSSDMPQGRGRAQLPPPGELASRVEEARNTAKILLQLIQSTPSEEIVSNELVREFGERCQSAQKSMQNYINCEHPAPDHDTLQTLIETNEQLSLAGSRYQRAVLAARRALGVATPNNGGSNGTSAFASPVTSPPPQNRDTNGSAFQPPAGPPPGSLSSFAPRNGAPQLPPPSNVQRVPSTTEEAVNPFADPEDHEDDTAPPVTEPKNYGSSNAMSAGQHQPAPSQTFNIDSEPIYARPRASTKDSEDIYGDSPAPAANASNQSAFAPARSGPGPSQYSSVTPSYMGRQSSAINGVTMHGATSNEDSAAEIDSHSGVGRASG